MYLRKLMKYYSDFWNDFFFFFSTNCCSKEKIRTSALLFRKTLLLFLLMYFLVVHTMVALAKPEYSIFEILVLYFEGFSRFIILGLMCLILTRQFGRVMTMPRQNAKLMPNIANTRKLVMSWSYFGKKTIIVHIHHTLRPQKNTALSNLRDIVTLWNLR